MYILVKIDVFRVAGWGIPKLEGTKSQALRDSFIAEYRNRFLGS